MSRIRQPIIRDFLIAHPRSDARGCVVAIQTITGIWLFLKRMSAEPRLREVYRDSSIHRDGVSETDPVAGVLLEWHTDLNNVNDMSANNHGAMTTFYSEHVYMSAPTVVTYTLLRHKCKYTADTNINK